MELSETEKAYIAGMLDGEGSVGIRQDSNYNTYSLGLEIYFSSKEFEDWISQKLQGEVKFKIYTYNPGNEKNKVGKGISILGKEAQKFLEFIKGYLVIKKNQCFVALNFPIVGQGQHTTEQQKLDQASWYLVMKDLNKKGPNVIE